MDLDLIDPCGTCKGVDSSDTATCVHRVHNAIGLLLVNLFYWVATRSEDL